jgi:hypothetical protein
MGFERILVGNRRSDVSVVIPLILRNLLFLAVVTLPVCRR